jgi:hypothetical protein
VNECLLAARKKVQWVATMPGASHVIDLTFRSIGGPKEKLKGHLIDENEERFWFKRYQ